MSKTDAHSYKDTLNLPRTGFDMKANLTVREPQAQERWRAEGLYQQIRRARAGRPRKVLHDGPPYANGDIHVGHLLNKVLKDIVVRWFNQRGYDSPYVPGWDCHGLPIEHKVAKDLGPKARTMTSAEIRALCHQEAMKWVGIQSAQFQRLGVMGDWEDPYLTLDPRYEAGILDVLADLVEKGYVFRQKKSIHWDPHDRTALAEAELEYQEVTSLSIYVNFPAASGVPAALGEGPWNFMIWTTTPWTLPANVAIAAHPRLEYVGLQYADPDSGQPVRAILAAGLVEKVMALRGVKEYEVLGRCTGKDLEGATYRHVFIDRESPVVLAEYVGAEDGTGLVHTAPGHGADDYKTGLAYNLPLLCPVDAGGAFTDEAPEWLRGQGVFAANPGVVDRLAELGVLYHKHAYKHSYPHGWRSLKPVIFRATEQWFIKVDHDDLRQRTLREIDRVEWHPAWGQKRIEAMVGNRPDWCISRQRAWGVPIPALACRGCEEQVMTAETVRHFRDLFREHGADAWFSRTTEELVPPGLACPKCGGKSFDKGTDILDVWFESGSSHRGVLATGFNLGYPAALYLEGSDQHRGWFQSSILTAVGSTGRAPFDAVLTHGFTVDEQGKKMSKSKRNALDAVKMVQIHGADVMRLYVASKDYADDIRMYEAGLGGINEMSESYRKVRNTFRYLLGNLEDYARFDVAAPPAPEELLELDRWALGRLNAVIRDVAAAYDAYEFYKVFQRIYQFCAGDLSSFYLDVLKDRLYAEAPEGPERRSAQYVLYRLHDVLTRLLAPILVHTAEELWAYLPAGPDKPASVHLALAPEPDPRFDDPARDKEWETLQQVRVEVLRELEKLRAAKTIGSSAAGEVRLGSDDPALAALLEGRRDLLGQLCMVAAVEVGGARPEGAADGLELPKLWIAARKTEKPKCARCWNHFDSVGSNPNHPALCARCAGVLDRTGPR